MEHAAPAFSASWHEASKTSGEKWVAPLSCSPEPQPQSVASTALDRTTMDGLISRAGKRDVQRLRRLDVDHASAWISALPSSSVDGKDTVMAPRVYLTCVRRLLGLPVISAPAPCPLCKQTMDVYGDHSLCCKKNGDRITRHNRLRNLVKQTSASFLEMEKLGLLLAIDVAVICPFALLKRSSSR